MKKITVKLGRCAYPIFIGENLENLGKYLSAQRYSGKTLVVTNTMVRPLYFARLKKGLERAGFSVSSIALPDGEQYKTLASVQKIYAAAVKAGLDRRSLIIALGGGVVGDIAGFAAATYMRGVPFIQVPTTLLAMVDSSVGGKTGVDLPEGKNLVGAFYQPKAVWIDVSTLKTLPERQLNNGLAEVIKYGVVKDRRFFDYLKHSFAANTLDFEKIVQRCCAIKASVVEQDEFEEKGIREILNFGHTFGHALETLTRYRAYLHGEAVAIGMILAGRLATKLGIFKQRQQQDLEDMVIYAGLADCPSRKFSANKLMKLMQRDKKAINGRLRLVLPTRLGKVIVKDNVPAAAVRAIF